MLPESGAGDFDVVRGSGATRVNKEGLIEDVRIISGELVTDGSFTAEGAQLVTNGDFSNGSTGWTLGTGWSVSGGKAVCDGTQTSSSVMNQSAVTNSNTNVKVSFTISGYVSGLFRVRNSGGFAGTYVSGNGTYVFYTDTGSATNIVLDADADFIGSIDDVSVKEVTEDTNIPRLDYTGGGCPSLLLEPLSTNLITYSEDFSDASWIKADCSVVSNFGVSPSGQTNASKLTFATTNTDARAQYNLGGLTTGNTYTCLLYTSPSPRDS